MIHWITNKLGTASRSAVDENKYSILDVRDLRDTEGNPPSLILKKIEEGGRLLKGRNKVVVCCDYGISRSNAIAAGILSKYCGYSFDDAWKYVVKKTGEKRIQLEVLASVRDALQSVRERKYMQKKNVILVTGGAGFLGSELIPLLKRKYNVVAPTKSQVDILTGALTLDLTVRKNRVSKIVHLATPEVYTTNQSMGEMLVMLKNVLDVCKTNKVALIYTSSWEVFSGYRGKLIKVPEDLPLKPGGTYGEAKFICETLLNQYSKNYGIDISVLRLNSVYGCGSNRPRFIHTFVHNAKNNLPIYTHRYKNGFATLDLLHISDAVRAVCAAVEKNTKGVVHIGGGKSFSTREIAHMIKRLCGSRSEVSYQTIDSYAPRVVMDISKAKRTLGWSPAMDIKKGLSEIIARY